MERRATRLRLRRTSSSLVEASMDLGAGGWQTFRYVTMPVISTALVSGGLLALALSLDEWSSPSASPASPASSAAAEAAGVGSVRGRS